VEPFRISVELITSNPITDPDPEKITDPLRIRNPTYQYRKKSYDRFRIITKNASKKLAKVKWGGVALFIYSFTGTGSVLIRYRTGTDYDYSKIDVALNYMRQQIKNKNITVQTNHLSASINQSLPCY